VNKLGHRLLKLILGLAHQSVVQSGRLPFLLANIRQGRGCLSKDKPFEANFVKKSITKENIL
jgi:hypothetical protein